MENIAGKIFKYAYHDTSFASIEIKAHSKTVEISFDRGIYKLDEEGAERELSGPVKMCFKLNDFLRSAEDAVNIRRLSKKNGDIEYRALTKLLQNSRYDVDMLYYSAFNNTVLICGSVGKAEIEIIIECVEDVLFSEY